MLEEFHRRENKWKMVCFKICKWKRQIPFYNKILTNSTQLFSVTLNFRKVRWVSPKHNSYIPCISHHNQLSLTELIWRKFNDCIWKSIKEHEHKHTMQSFPVCNLQIYLHYPLRILKMGLSVRSITEAYDGEVFPVIMERHLAIGRERGKGQTLPTWQARDPLPSLLIMTFYSKHGCLYLLLLQSALNQFERPKIARTVKEESRQLPMIYITWAFQRIPFLLFITKLLLLPSQLLSFSSNTFGFLTTFLQTTQKEEPTNAKWKHKVSTCATLFSSCH